MNFLKRRKLLAGLGEADRAMGEQLAVLFAPGARGGAFPRMNLEDMPGLMELMKNPDDVTVIPLTAGPVGDTEIRWLTFGVNANAAWSHFSEKADADGERSTSRRRTGWCAHAGLPDQHGGAAATY